MDGSTPIAVAKSGAEGGGWERCLRNHLRGSKRGLVTRAKASRRNPVDLSGAQMRLMMQSLLADRFKLAVHYETRQLPVYVLLMDPPGKLGPLLQQHVNDSSCPTTPWVPSPPPTAPPQTLDARFPGPCGGMLDMPPSVPGRIRAGARNVTMEMIASSLPGTETGVDRPVLRPNWPYRNV